MTNPIQALKLAAVVGSLMFALNHGTAIARGEMNPQRWLSAILGFGVPFLTGIYCPCAQPREG